MPVRKCLASFFFLVAASALRQAAAESPAGTIGRSRDGTPYRVDRSGFRLTDQVAELQVEVDELTKQVETLENDLAAKNKQLNERCPQLRELAGKSTLAPPCPSCDPLVAPLRERITALERQVAIPCPSCSPCQTELARAREELGVLQRATPPPCPSCQNCELLISPYRQRITALERATPAPCPSCQDCSTLVAPCRERLTALERATPAPCPSCQDCAAFAAPYRDRLTALEKATPVPCPQCECSAEIDPLRTQIARLQESLAQKENVVRGVSAVEEQLRSCHRELEDRSDAVASVSADTQRFQRELQAQKEELEKRAARTVELEQQIASLKRELAAAQRTAQPSPERAEDRPRDIALEKVVKEVNALIITRKELYDALRQKGRGVSLRLQPLATNDGRSLDSLRAAVAARPDAAQSAALAAALSEIERRLREDIATLKRLTR